MISKGHKALITGLIKFLQTDSATIEYIGASTGRCQYAGPTIPSVIIRITQFTRG